MQSRSYFRRLALKSGLLVLSLWVQAALYAQPWYWPLNQDPVDIAKEQGFAEINQNGDVSEADQDRLDHRPPMRILTVPGEMSVIDGSGRWRPIRESESTNFLFRQSNGQIGMPIHFFDQINEEWIRRGLRLGANAPVSQPHPLDGQMTPTSSRSTLIESPNGQLLSFALATTHHVSSNPGHELTFPTPIDESYGVTTPWLSYTRLMSQASTERAVIMSQRFLQGSRNIPERNRLVTILPDFIGYRYRIQVPEAIREDHVPHSARTLTMQDPTTGNHYFELYSRIRDMSELQNPDFIYRPLFVAAQEDSSHLISLVNEQLDSVEFWRENSTRQMARTQIQYFSITGGFDGSGHGQNYLLQFDPFWRPTGRFARRDNDATELTPWLMQLLTGHSTIEELRAAGITSSSSALIQLALDTNSPAIMDRTRTYNSFERMFNLNQIANVEHPRDERLFFDSANVRSSIIQSVRNHSFFLETLYQEMSRISGVSVENLHTAFGRQATGESSLRANNSTLNIYAVSFLATYLSTEDKSTIQADAYPWRLVPDPQKPGEMMYARFTQQNYDELVVRPLRQVFSSILDSERARSNFTTRPLAPVDPLIRQIYLSVLTENNPAGQIENALRNPNNLWKVTRGLLMAGLRQPSEHIFESDAPRSTYRLKPQVAERLLQVALQRFEANAPASVINSKEEALIMQSLLWLVGSPDENHRINPELFTRFIRYWLPKAFVIGDPVPGVDRTTSERVVIDSSVWRRTFRLMKNASTIDSSTRRLWFETLADIAMPGLLNTSAREGLTTRYQATLDHHAIYELMMNLVDAEAQARSPQAAMAYIRYVQNRFPRASGSIYDWPVYQRLLHEKFVALQALSPGLGNRTMTLIRQCREHFD